MTRTLHLANPAALAVALRRLIADGWEIRGVHGLTLEVSGRDGRRAERDARQADARPAGGRAIPIAVPDWLTAPETGH